jgi:hypothetical protein
VPDGALEIGARDRFVATHRFIVAQTLTAVSLFTADFTPIVRGTADLAGHARCS